MPYDSLVDREVAGALIPEERASAIIQNVVTKSAVLSLGRRLPNMTRKQLRLKVLDVLPTAYFVDGDTGLKQTSHVEWVNKYINAEEIAVIVPIPINVIEDSEDDLLAEITPRIEEAFARKIDGAVLANTDGDAPADWPDDLLTQIVAAGHDVDLSDVVGADGDLYDAILGEGGVMSMVEEDGFMVTGHAAVQSMRAKYRNLRDSLGQPIFMRSPNDGQNMQGPARYDLDGSPIFFLENGAVDPADALQFSGDWRQLVYSIRTEISFKIFDSGVIQDASQAIIYNLIQNDMVAVRAVMRMGWQVPNPVSILNDDESTRFPFAALVP